MIYFTAHTVKCVCHCRKAMFRLLGMYNFATNLNFACLPQWKKSIWSSKDFMNVKFLKKIKLEDLMKWLGHSQVPNKQIGWNKQAGWN